MKLRVIRIARPEIRLGYPIFNIVSHFNLSQRGSSNQSKDHLDTENQAINLTD